MAAPRKDLEADLDGLYAASPAAFTAERNELAKRLAAAGRREDAARVKALKKPSSAAWAVNQLALGKSDALDALFAAAARMRKPGDLKEALRVRREALTAAARAAEGALAASGHAPNADVQRKISATLEALAAYAGKEAAPAAGRLTEDLPAPGFDEIASLGLLGGAPSKREEAPAAAHSAAPPTPHGKKRAPAQASFPSKEEIARARATAQQKRSDAAREKARLERTESTARKRLAAAEKALSAVRRRRAGLEGSLSKTVAEEEKLTAESAAARKDLDAATAALEGSRRPD